MKRNQHKDSSQKVSSAEAIKGGHENETKAGGSFPVQAKRNQTGLPDNLKAGIENLSGQSMDDVKVHYNSSQPATLQAHAYAQGTDIHVAPGQERHLPHEAWHVVQQKQGRVKPTRQLKGKTPMNDDAGLEHEADVMGAQALQRKGENGSMPATGTVVDGVVQRKPSTFLQHAQPVLDIKAGEGEGSKGVRDFFGKIDFLGVFNTKWTHLQKAITLYTSLNDAPVTANHLVQILAIQRKLNAWKTHHDTENEEKELNSDEQAKLVAVQSVERALPEEIQYARAEKENPENLHSIVASKLEFIFEDALGEDFMDLHSTRTWGLFEAAFPNFDQALLQQDIPVKDQIDQMSDQQLYFLAGARTNALKGGYPASAKISWCSVHCNGLGRSAGKELNFDTGLGVFAQRALLEIVEQDLAPLYPDLAQDIAGKTRQLDLKGINLSDFFQNAGQTYVDNAPHTKVDEITPEELIELRNDIKESPEYAELVRIAQTHSNPFNTGQHLPAEEEEDLQQREGELLNALTFTLQQQNAQGQVIPQQHPQAVPQEKKEQIVMAVMTIEKLIGKRLGKYPEFILIQKQGEKYRANADSENRFIRYDIDFTMSTAVHELGHYYENSSSLDSWFSIYLLMRSRHANKAAALGKNPGKVYSNSIPSHLEEPGFLGGLQGLENRYQTEYTARYYKTGHTEMMSMFTERLINKSKMDSILENDPQAFAVLLKVMRSNALPDWPLERLGFKDE